MDVREKAIQRWGFESAKTIAICYLVEYHKRGLAEQLFEELVTDEEEVV